MDQDRRLIFECKFVNLALEIALAAALERLGNNPQAATELDALERKLLADIQNLAPKGPVSESVMRRSVAAAVRKVQLAFERARGKA